MTIAASEVIRGPSVPPTQARAESAWAMAREKVESLVMPTPKMMTPLAISLNGIPLQKFSPSWFSANPARANISPMFEVGVGAYWRNDAMADAPSIRTRCTRRNRLATKLFVVAMTRWSVEFRCSKESPDCHSSASRPENGNIPSGLSPPPDIAWASRRTAPFRRARAAAVDVAVVMMSGSLTSSTLSHAVMPKALARASGRSQRPRTF